MTTFTVGGLPVEEAQAHAWAEEYLLPGPVASGYPAYDAYEGSGNPGPTSGTRTCSPRPYGTSATTRCPPTTRSRGCSQP